MTLQQRANSYAAAFPQFPASHLRVVEEGGGPCLYGTWVLGNNYRAKSALYGAYPPSYLERVMALFPDAFEDSKLLGRYLAVMVLHVFSGSLPKGEYLRVDVNPDREPDVVANVYELPTVLKSKYQIVFADPPYTADDAERYATPMVDRRRALASIAQVTEPGGHLVWLDTVWPMFRKAEWRTVGRIALIRSTNHRFRMVSVFERREA